MNLALIILYSHVTKI